MKKELEKLLAFLIPAILIEKLLAAYSNHFFGNLLKGNMQSLSSFIETYPTFTVGEIITYVNMLNAVIGLLPLLVIAVWLWKQEKALNGRPFLWAAGALFLNYWILLLFIGQLIYAKEHTAIWKAT